MKGHRHRQFIYFCIGLVVANLACNQKSKPQTQTVSPIPDEANAKVVETRTWHFRADPFGINDLRPEGDVKPLEYGNSQILGLMSKADKDQLALLAARLPVLHRIREINGIVVTSPTNAELFFRLYRVYCEKTPSNAWTITRVTSVVP